MNRYEDPFQNLTELDERYTRIEAKTAQIDRLAHELEGRKREIYEKLVVIESKSTQIPSEIEKYITILLTKVEERKKLIYEWRVLSAKRVEMDNYTTGTEKILFDRGDFAPNAEERQEMELLVKQYEEISIKQEDVLNRRVQVQEDEKSALNEIEKIVAKM